MKHNQKKEDIYLTLKECAEYTGKSFSTIRRLLDSHKIEGIKHSSKTGKQWKILKKSVHDYFESVEENSNKIHEAADVFYHLLMYLETNDVKIEEVMEELEKRKK